VESALVVLLVGYCGKELSLVCIDRRSDDDV